MEKSEMNAVLKSMTPDQRELFELGRTSVSKRQPKVVHGTQLTGKIEWYTPPEYIEAARLVMGSIDCDPASSILAQKVVQAVTYYTIHNNGLTSPWQGNIWLNPPYAASIIRPFVEKLLAHLDGTSNQAVMLTHCNSDTAWYHAAWNGCAAFCQTRGRVKFYDASGISNSPTHGHVFMYFGRRRKKFKDIFSRFGAVSIPFK
jgi:hypothetical protein